MLSKPRSRWLSLPLLLTLCLLLTNVVPPTPSVVAAGTAPILLVLNSADDTVGAKKPYDAYLGEILRAEGFNSFDTVQLSTIISAGSLSSYKLVILAETALPTQAPYFTSYVSGGGRLLAMRPDTGLAGVFGLNSVGTQQPDGYLKINGATTAGAGLPATTLQIHGQSDRYTVSGATVIATLYSDSTTATSNPAVVTNVSGSGKAAAFTYDLAQNVVMMRQGNPANATFVSPRTGIVGDVDGDCVVRTIDLFQSAPTYGSTNDCTTTPDPNPPATYPTPWVDRNNIPIPQADEQMRLMGHIIEDLTIDLLPMPRLWYFPDSAMTMLVPTGDAHGNSVTEFQDVINSVNAHRGEITLYGGLAGALTPSNAATWVAAGNTVGIHPYAKKVDATYGSTNLTQGYNKILQWWSDQGFYSATPAVPPSLSARNHQVAWEGWTDAAETAVNQFTLSPSALSPSRSIMDANFYTWGGWLKNGAVWPHGYVTGSGQPMKFIKSDGTILRNYQQVTQLVDEQLFKSIDYTSQCPSGSPHDGFECLTAPQDYDTVAYAATAGLNPNPTGANKVSKDLIDASFAGDYAAIMTQFHVDYYSFGDPKNWAEYTMEYAYSKGIPIWNVDKWLNFTETRHDANFTNMAWNAANGQLAFTMTSGTATPAKLTMMVPASTASGALQTVTVDGTNTPFTVKNVKGRQYAFFLASPGSNRAIVATYLGLAPSVTNATTNEDTQSAPASGLVITRNVNDSTSTHFKISGITGGTLYQNNGTTVINNNTFITVAQGNAGLRFTPAPDAVASGSFSAQSAPDTSGTGLGPSATATITVTPVNDAPQFTLPVTTATVNEDAGAQTLSGFATGIRPGPVTATDESGQTLTFNVTANTNAALFSVQPAISAAGTLTFTPAPNTNGTATVTIVLKDNGGNSAPNVDTSGSQTFTINVTAVNDAPQFTLPSTTATVNEDAGAQTLSGFATAISAGPANEAAQSLAFTLTNNNNALFSAQPALDAAGTLTFTPAPNANGTATVQATLKDNGGLANGGVDSLMRSFTINITAVNDAPQFVAGPDKTVSYNATPQTFASWAASLSAGPSDEAAQTVTFQVTGNTNAALFSVQPAVDAAGTLTFTPAADTSGSADITLVLKDNGGTANGGVDTSVAKTFKITVNLPGVVSGVVFRDQNRDAIYDGGDSGIGGVGITVKDASGTTTITSVTTNADGTYSLTVTPGSYTLVETQPKGYGSSTPDTLALNVPIAGLANQNFGDTLASISGSVYVDADNSGTRAAGESGIGNVNITLTGTDANSVAVNTTVTTAADGSYTFNDLLSGTYSVSAAQPSGYDDGLDAIGSAGGTLGNDMISAITLAGGAEANGYLFSERLPAPVGTPTPIDPNTTPTPIDPNTTPTPIDPNTTPTVPTIPDVTPTVPTPTVPTPTVPVPAGGRTLVYLPLTMGR